MENNGKNLFRWFLAELNDLVIAYQQRGAHTT